MLLEHHMSASPLLLGVVLFSLASKQPQLSL